MSAQEVVALTAPAALAQVRLLVVGDVMLDRYWFGDVSRISPEAPVPIVRIEKREERLGGAANVARNAAALGAKTSLLGVVGDDEAGSRVERLLEGGGIHSYLQRDAAISTIIKLRVIGRQQQMLRIDFEDAPSDTVLRDKLAQFNALLPHYDVVVLSDYAKGSLVNVAEMIKAARKAGKIVMVDPKGDDFSRYSGASVLTPNKSELRRVIGSWNTEEQLTERAQQMRAQLGLDALLLTRSEEGMSLYTADEVVHMPTDAREVFDVSGAGDTVIATMAAMLGAGMSLGDAVRTANRAGGIVVGKLGTATVTREELFPQ
ncbi:D-glycero-beta-D-manno-heptose-7-phosphate kinase [Janthinobacterium lividum]|uniref:D-glycero-beta-D-manno-heptose-7-phosphate kinase n=1 Tax=Janthinobacterium lividum TaxID=29581 RepID=A0ABU0XW36_9BURK|nr:D-glycero-beta-D-manno-heptose-7-phosphate kinase [Janthinobacterium lividum]MBR7635906.1 D-glycero-beta-D-manno-heptose-7-phosphate kinase [Janthinobacterium lividum]MDQ4627767.1 D-glycero-beta-D-manno-heptose-7-phosphate kinase [Janthinobacterium lividum]MDQ4676585.1 D-glycero-beta-D-manno-heptose-7-phosphate kinase [Janthinobacterium lividum]MDQ4686943.1 D-glycero-beta-D-manno-heptose-7-phosphate kinase [Janthinobacterium lividum]